MFKKGLVKCRDYIFNFFENPMIPSDNNESERGIRKLKIILKNSCTFRSNFGADAFLELHSIVEIAKKHDKTPYNEIQANIVLNKFCVSLKARCPQASQKEPTFNPLFRDVFLWRRRERLIQPLFEVYFCECV